MLDVIQQAREALERVRGGLPPSAPWPPTAGEWSLLYAVVEAADAGHLIDTRRLGIHEFVALIDRHLTGYYPADVFDGSSGDPGLVLVVALRDAVNAFLAAAEREAQ